MRIVHLVRLARPEQWIKNGIVLLPIVFALRLTDPAAWAEALVAVAAFCLVSSAAYIVNDIQDRHFDRLHPHKKARPLAAGHVPVGAAWTEAAVLLAAGLAVAWALSPMLLIVIASYVLLQAAYTFSLKRRMIIDVICIALGFVLRAAAGAVAIRVELSPWLFICTFTICLFMGFCKRRSEVATIGDTDTAGQHRATLLGYTPQFLTHLTTLTAGIAIISYLLYATSARTVEHFGTDYLLYTLPLVIYGICRFEMLSSFGRYTDPTDLVLRDRPFQLTAVLWGLMVLAILWQGRATQHWLTARY
jgi:4-hydroxybenzoate polyprenyltransferase